MSASARPCLARASIQEALNKSIRDLSWPLVPDLPAAGRRGAAPCIPVGEEAQGKDVITTVLQNQCLASLPGYQFWGGAFVRRKEPLNKSEVLYNHARPGGNDLSKPLDSGPRRAAAGVLPSTACSRRGLPPASMQASRRIPDFLSIAAAGLLDRLFPTRSTAYIPVGVPSRRIPDFLSIAATGVLPSRRIPDILSINGGSGFRFAPGQRGGLRFSPVSGRRAGMIKWHKVKVTSMIFFRLSATGRQLCIHQRFPDE